MKNPLVVFYAAPVIITALYMALLLIPLPASIPHWPFALLWGTFYIGSMLASFFILREVRRYSRTIINEFATR